MFKPDGKYLRFFEMNMEVVIQTREKFREVSQEFVVKQMCGLFK